MHRLVTMTRYGNGVLYLHVVGRKNSNYFRFFFICIEFNIIISNTENLAFYWLFYHQKERLKRHQISRVPFVPPAAILNSRASFRLAHMKLQKKSVHKRINTLVLKLERQIELFNNLDTPLNTIKITNNIELSRKKNRDREYTMVFGNSGLVSSETTELVWWKQRWSSVNHSANIQHGFMIKTL